MESVGSFEAKTHLPQLLERVARGEEFTITKHGKPVARLVPVTAIKLKPDVRAAVEAMKQFRWFERPRDDRGRTQILGDAWHGCDQGFRP
jgi:prevent-host-death family protein